MKTDMTPNEMCDYIFRLEHRAEQLHGSLKAFCIFAQLERSVFKRLRYRGLYSINYLTLLRLCYGLRLTPNQIMRFEEWEDLPVVAPPPINEEFMEKIRIDWRKSMNFWHEGHGRSQKPKTNKTYDTAKF